MDHIPLPRNPYFPPVKIPYLGHKFSQYQYDGLGIDGFLERHGSDSNIIFSDESDGNNKTIIESLCLFQSWCFFGALIETFRLFKIDVTVDDVVEEVPNFGAINVAVTTRHLRSLFLKLEERTRFEDNVYDSDGEDMWCDAFSVAVENLTKISDFVFEMDVEKIRDMERQHHTQKPLLIDRIHLSVLMLGQYLTEALNLINTNLVDFGRSPWLKERLLEAGWCRSETHTFLDQYGTDPTSLFYLTHFDRWSLGRTGEHTACGDSFRCNRENLNHAVYETKHSEDCPGLEICTKIVLDVSKQVMDGFTPLLQAFQHDDGQLDVRISTAETTPDSWHRERESYFKFVCISHVWSDGLGNLIQNSLPICQIKRLQRLVDLLYEPHLHPIPFWIDTICVPLERALRDVAIIAMRKTYTIADKVLVLDSFMSQTATQGIDDTEIIMRIRASTWNRRLWTFHEANLANVLCYQFKDCTFTYESLQHKFWKRQYDTDLLLQESRSFPQCLANWERDEGDDFQIQYRRASFDRVTKKNLAWINNQSKFKAPKFHTSLERSLERPVDMLTDLLQCLRYKWTSRLEDETICLGGILGLPVDDLVKLGTKEARMQKFLSLFDTLPAHMLFINRLRLQEEPYRWMPCSFLGEGSSGNINQKPEVTSPTVEGLQLELEGMILEDTHFLENSRNMATVRYKEQLYRISPEAPLRLSPYASKPLAMIHCWTLVSSDDPPPGTLYNRTDGVLVTVVKHEENMIIVRFEGTVKIQRIYDSFHELDPAILSSKSLKIRQKWIVR